MADHHPPLREIRPAPANLKADAWNHVGFYNDGGGSELDKRHVGPGHSQEGDLIDDCTPPHWAVMGDEPFPKGSAHFTVIRRPEPPLPLQQIPQMFLCEMRSLPAPVTVKHGEKRH
ncbi:hypothetical protein INR49_015689 [Caranx melampygus]|nr:hypothetical protein INR49_015689 [Caranx melampygus]